MQRGLVILGLALVAVGLIWPWLARSGLGRLPGDIRYQGENFHFYFPLTTGLLISALISLILWLLRK